MLLKLAWRNIWRNRRRTYITAASVLFAVVLAAFMQAIQKGAWDQMVQNVVNFYYGYAQIHSSGYWEEQSLEKAFPESERWSKLPEQFEGLLGVVPRIESFALASAGNLTRGVLLIGTDPAREDAMTRLSERLTGGAYLQPDDAGALVAEGVAAFLKLGVGDTIVLISQGYHGVNAAGKYPIRGIVKFGSPELNKRMVFLPLRPAQQFYGAEGLLTSLALHVADKDAVPHLVRKLRRFLGPEFEVLDWQEMMPELVEAREIDTAGNYVVMFILYLIIAFGIFGTILMMTKEREYEFGILLAIGMHRRQLGFVVWLEILLLGFLGVLAGLLLALPLIYHFHVNPLDFTQMSDQMADAYEKFGFEPIFPAAFEWLVFGTQMTVVFLITSVLAFYPLLKIRTLQPVEAMRR
ncbi:MAG: ABC transporter permease [Bacteroidetes bacterium]|nr:MAG: ABC transporter permease [Bacteroidota bacterium]